MICTNEVLHLWDYIIGGFTVQTVLIYLVKSTNVITNNKHERKI